MDLEYFQMPVCLGVRDAWWMGAGTKGLTVLKRSTESTGKKNEGKRESVEFSSSSFAKRDLALSMFTEDWRSQGFSSAVMHLPSLQEALGVNSALQKGKEKR